MNPRFLVLLGAGASIEAGLPSALAVTQLLIRLSDDPNSARIRRIGRVVTVLREQAARLSGVSVDEVDFEPIFGALVEAVERRDPIAGSTIAALLSPHLDGTDLSRLLLDVLLYLRNVFLPSQSVSYLTGLLDTVRKHSGVLATLNYDLTVERWFVERRFEIRTGFENLDWKGFPDAYEGVELLKLHGSVHWVRSTLSMDDSDRVLSHLIFHRHPFPVGIDHTARWSPNEATEGVRPLMNIGIAKEQLYVTPPFAEIFRRFEMHLASVGLIVVVGYSFRDHLINRLLLQAIEMQLSASGKRPALYVVDPYADALVAQRPILRALAEYGVLTSREQTAGSINEAELLLWLNTVLPPAPNSITYRTPPIPRLDHRRERLADLCIELTSLRSQIEGALARPMNSWRILQGIVETVERCRGTYDQAGVKSSLPSGLRRVIAKMHSQQDVASPSWRAAGEELLVGLANLVVQLDAELENRGPLTSDSFDGVTADHLFDQFLDRLRDAGLDITRSQFIP